MSGSNNNNGGRRTLRQVAQGLFDLFIVLRWARQAPNRSRFAFNSTTLPDF